MVSLGPRVMPGPEVQASVDGPHAEWADAVANAAGQSPVPETLPKHPNDDTAALPRHSDAGESDAEISPRH
jgi:hypothetical protein